MYVLGEGEESKLWLASNGRTVEQLFLSHVTKVAKAIKQAWPHMSIIMWDDMMRGMSEDTLKGEEDIWSIVHHIIYLAPADARCKLGFHIQIAIN